MATARPIYIFRYDLQRMEEQRMQRDTHESGRKSRGNLRSVRKKKERKMLVATAPFIVSLPHGVVADVNRNKQYSLPVLSLLTVSGITTAGALFWLLRSHESRDL